MNFTDDQLTQDDFLGGLIRIWQPKVGYRAATDPVFLAASVSAKPGQKVLELGCGAGTALSCLCRRVRRLDAFGLEIQANYAELARRNAADNSLEYSVFTGDLLDMPDPIRTAAFDHVFTNPPFYDVSASSAPKDRSPSPNSGRANKISSAFKFDLSRSLNRLKSPSVKSVLSISNPICSSKMQQS